MKTIVVTGGGSGGHIAPIRALAPELLKTKKIYWIGATPFEEQAALDLNIPFKKIYSGKLRRYFSWKNFVDIFRIEIAGWQSLFLLVKNRPEMVFSTGGFVSVPVVIAAWLLRIPVIIHEQSIGFGLANKIGALCAYKILLAFPKSQKYIPQKWQKKIHIVGNPIRSDLLNGSSKNLEKTLKTNFADKAILYVTGGGQGSKLINNTIFQNLDTLTKKYIVIHQTGKTGIVEAQKINSSIRANTKIDQKQYESYFPFEFIGSELADIYASADVVVARSGAGTVNELSFFDIYSIFVPLRPTQDDEQMKNAEWFLENHTGKIINQSDFNKKTLISELDKIPNTPLRRLEQKNIESNNSLVLLLRVLI